MEWCNLNLQFCIAQNIGHRCFSFSHWSLAWITPSVTRRSNTFLKVNNHPKHYLEACECIEKCMLSSHLHLVLLTSILRASLASASSKPPFDNDASFNLNLLIIQHCYIGVIPQVLLEAVQKQMAATWGIFRLDTKSFTQTAGDLSSVQRTLSGSESFS